jgi:CNT family concentrative nucleoside transporter
LVITENNISYKFKQAKQQLAKNSAENNSEQARLIPSQGFSFKSLWRGLIGMIVILGIAFVLSSDRKKISWRLVIVGISLQVLIAISIQYIPAVEWFFKQVSKGFVAILDFTRAGSEFLLGGLMDVSSYGFIFLFQILPTVIFFSALTSLFFYLGILQKIVQALAWVMKVAPYFWFRKPCCCW